MSHSAGINSHTSQLISLKLYCDGTEQALSDCSRTKKNKNIIYNYCFAEEAICGGKQNFYNTLSYCRSEETFVFKFPQLNFTLFNFCCVHVG